VNDADFKLLQTPPPGGWELMPDAWMRVFSVKAALKMTGDVHENMKKVYEFLKGD
jgi:hypothetical protein